VSDKTRALTERYLNAVKQMLPSSQQADIIAELREAIEARIEDRESELGRPLKAVEVEAILKSFGHPIIVAGRYGPQRTLIGPALFPIWWLSLRVCLGIATVFYAANFVVALFDYGGLPDGFLPAMRVWPHYISSVIFIVGVVTVGTILIERLKPGPFENWSLKDLSPVKLKPTGRIEIGLALVFEVLGLLFWALLPFFGHQLLDAMFIHHDLEGHRTQLHFLQLADIWWPTLWAIIVAIAALQVVVRLVQFVWPDRPVRNAAAHLLLNLAGLVFAGVALSSLPLLQMSPELDGRLDHLLDLVNMVIQIGLWIMVAINVAKSVGALIQIGRGLSPGGSPRPAR
jgi:hypothetical protein